MPVHLCVHSYCHACVCVSVWPQRILSVWLSGFLSKTFLTLCLFPWILVLWSPSAHLSRLRVCVVCWHGDAKTLSQTQLALSCKITADWLSKELWQISVYKTSKLLSKQLVAFLFRHPGSYTHTHKHTCWCLIRGWKAWDPLCLFRWFITLCVCVCVCVCVCEPPII